MASAPNSLFLRFGNGQSTARQNPENLIATLRAKRLPQEKKLSFPVPNRASGWAPHAAEPDCGERQLQVIGW